MAAPYLALGLAGPHLVELTTNRALLSRWDALPVAFSVLGIDRVDGSPPAPVTLQGSAVGATLAGSTKFGRFLVAETPQRDHPYNIARRVASLAHLSGGRSGVLIGIRDAYAPDRPEKTSTWSRAGLDGGAPLDARTAYDAARAIRALEQSWPYDTIIGNRDTGILVESNRIVHVDLDDTFSIAGPLNVPEPPTGASVIAWYAATAPELPPVDGPDTVELVLGTAGAVPVVTLGDSVPAGTPAGIVLRAAPDQPLGDLLDAAERWLADGLAPVAPGGSLRAALNLPFPAPLPSSARPAFPVPQPQAAL